MLEDNIDLEVLELQKKIGSNVKRMRINKGLTQIQLSSAIGHDSTTIISQAEIGLKKHFNIEQLYKISKVLECNITDFFD